MHPRALLSGSQPASFANPSCSCSAVAMQLSARIGGEYPGTRQGSLVLSVFFFFFFSLSSFRFVCRFFFFFFLALYCQNIVGMASNDGRVEARDCKVSWSRLIQPTSIPWPHSALVPSSNRVERALCRCRRKRPSRSLHYLLDLWLAKPLPRLLRLLLLLPAARLASPRLLPRPSCSMQLRFFWGAFGSGWLAETWLSD